MAQNLTGVLNSTTSTPEPYTTARTTSIYFDSRKWIKNRKVFWFARCIKIFFLFWFSSSNNFILDSDSLSKWTNALIHFDSQFISIFIHFDVRFNLILLILIRFDFDSSRIMIHRRIKNQSKWIVIHSIANQAGRSPALVTVRFFNL